ncbi:hypothetical protein VULLAG_LOCUS10373 [Vulpes lagopus]
MRAPPARSSPALCSSASAPAGARSPREGRGHGRGRGRGREEGGVTVRPERGRTPTFSLLAGEADLGEK